jgi:CspA family cold shock protein
MSLNQHYRAGAAPEPDDWKPEILPDEPAPPVATRAGREIGTVIWFSDEKGFGFVKPDFQEIDGGPDCFIHFKHIRAPGFKTLKKGDRIQYLRLEIEGKGPAATEIVKVTE